MSMKRKMPKRILAVVLVMTMLVGLLAMNASGATSNDSLKQALSAINANSAVKILALNGQNIYGDIDVAELLGSYPSLQRLEIANTNVTNVLNAGGVAIEATDTFYNGDRNWQASGSSYTYTQSGQNMAVSNLINLIKIRKADGTTADIPLEMLDAGTVTIDGTTYPDLDPKTGTISGSDLSNLTAGTYSATITFPVKYAASAKLNTTVTLIIANEYSFDKSHRTVYDGGSTVFTFTKNDGSALTLSDFVFKLQSSTVNNLNAELSSTGKAILVTVEASYVDTSTGAYLYAYKASDTSTKLATARVTKVSNASVSSLKLREYYYDNDSGTRKLGTNVTLGAVNTSGGISTEGDMIHISGGTNISSVTATNITDNIYTDTTMYLLIGGNGNNDYIPARYQSQIDVEIGRGYEDYLKAELTSVDMGGEEKVLALVITAKTLQAYEFKATSSSDLPISITLNNSDTDSVGGHINAHTYGNSVMGYMIYQVPEVYQYKSQMDLEEAIHNGDEKITLVAHYELNDLNQLEQKSAPGATIVEGETLYLVAAAYYGNSSQLPYIVDTDGIVGWYHKEVTASQMFDSTQTLIQNSAGANTPMKASLGTGSGGNFITKTKALEVEANAYDTADSSKNEATLIFGPKNAPNYIYFGIKLIEKTVDSYIIVPDGYLAASSYSDPYEALIHEIDDFNDDGTVGDLYNLNILGKDIISVGGTNEYAVWTLYNNGKTEKVTNAVNGVQLLNDSAGVFTGPAAGSVSANYTVTAGSGNVEGETVDMVYTGVDGITSKTITLTISGVEITGLYTVYQDYMGNFYSSDKALYDKVTDINQMPSGGLEIPAGTNTTKAFVLYKFSNEDFYLGMTNWKDYAVYNDYGTNVYRPVFSTLTASPDTYITINDSTVAPANTEFTILSGNNQGTETVTATLTGTDPTADTTVTVGTATYDVSLVDNFQKVDTVKVVKPVATAVYAHVDSTTSTDLNTATNSVNNFTTLYSDANTATGFIPGNGAYTQPTVLLSTEDLSEWGGGASTSQTYTWDKEFLGSVALSFNSDNMSTDSTDAYAFKVDSYSTSSIILTYEYTYTLNGIEKTETLYEIVPTISPTTGVITYSIGLKGYQLYIAMQKPSVVNYYFVSDARVNTVDKNVYTQSQNIGDIINVYPVVLSESVFYDPEYEAENKKANGGTAVAGWTPDIISKADADGESGAFYSKYLSYATTDDFYADTCPSVLTLTKNGVSTVSLRLAGRYIDLDDRIYYEYVVDGPIDANVTTAATIEQTMVKIAGSLITSGSTLFNVDGQFDSFDGTALSTSAHIYFGHMVEPKDAYVIDITAGINTTTTPSLNPNYATNEAVYVDIKYNLSSSSDQGGFEVNPEYFDGFDDSAVTMMPGSSNYNENYTNVLRYDELEKPSGATVSVVYDSAAKGQLKFYADTPGDYEIGFYMVNKSAVRIPNFTDYRSITFTVEPANLGTQTVYYGIDTSISTYITSNMISIEENGTSYLDAALLKSGTLSMVSNISTTPVTTEVLFKDSNGNAIATMTVRAVGTKVSSVKFNLDGTASLPINMINGEVHALYWEVIRSSVETTPVTLSATKEPIDTTTWTRGYPDASVDRNLDLDGSTLTASATEYGTIQYEATYNNDPTWTSTTPIDFWAIIDASKTASYAYTISSSDTSINQTVTDLDVGAGSTTAVYIWDTTTKTLVSGIDYVISDNASAVTIANYDTHTVELYAVANGNATITIYPEAGGLITLPIVVQQQIPTYTVSGTVKNESGVDVIGATVTLTDGTNTYAAKTDASGVYTVDVPDGTYAVTVTATGYNDGADTVTINGNAATLDVVLTAPTYSVSGTITDEEDGNPLSGAKVVISDGVSFTKEITTDSNGAYTITDVPRSSYAVTASCTGYSDNKVDIVITSTDLTGVDIKLTAAGQTSTDYVVAGRVVNENGDPVEGAKVMLVASDGSASYEATTNANGEYTLNAPDGGYQLIVVADGYTDVTKDVVVYGGDVTVEDVVMSETPLYNITLTVENSSNAELDRETAYAGDTVTVTTVKIFGYDAVVTATDADGNAVTVEEKSKTVFEFVMPDSDVAVEVTFVEDNHNCPSALYTDLNLKGWYHEYTDYVLEHGIMTGTSDNPKTFEPSTSLTRAMIVEILYNVEGRPSVEGLEHTFADVKEGAWYGDAVTWAVNNKVIAGYSETQFGPTNLLTREEMVVILRNFAEYREYDFSASASLSKYTDNGSVSSWATTAMQWAVAEGLIEGRTSTTIVPGGTSMRSEVATVITKFCRLYEIY